MTSHVTRRNAIKTGAAAAAIATMPMTLTAQSPARVKLRVMETSDLHVNIVPYDYYRDGADNTVGLAKTATLVKAARLEAKNHLLLDNGDFLQGSSMGDWIAYKKGLKSGDVHPMIAAMNAMGYACSTLGNHEFNYGLDFLDTGVKSANFPFVCANLVKADGTPLVRPWLIIEQKVTDEAGAAQTVKVGIIGFTPPQVMQWDKAHLEGKARASDIVSAARVQVPAMRAAGADIVVALCHSGIVGGEYKGGEENAALHLAKLDGVDVILTGHQHLVFPGARAFDGIDGVDNKRGALNGKPCVQPGFWGSHLGIVDLDLERTGTSWKVADFKVEARPIFERTQDRRIVSKADADAAILATVAAAHEATLVYVREPVGETSAPINSYFALVADDPSVQIVADAQIAYVKGLMAGTAFASLPVLSAAAPFKSGGRSGPNFFTDIKAGPIAIKNVADIYLYPNTVQAVKVTGAQVREWLERSAGIFNRIDPARTEEQALINPGFPAFNFDVIDGVTYRIDVTQASRYDGQGKLVAPDARRIVELAFNGQPISETAEFIVATNNYRASGGGDFPGTKTTVVLEAPDLNRDVVVRHIIDKKRINPTADNNWSIAPFPASANVTFVSGPGSVSLKPAGLKAEAAGDAADGFVKYRLRT
ncbi:MAG: bifunctional 2',3'-cyclic-nucleotide 2'-phosphodiesterase/3'-nucleotidase [Bosea sp. (in: a-proteobacteria)]